jgi:dCMP deaminase
MSKKNRQYVDLAVSVALIFSKDPSTKVGCILTDENNDILSTGYNGFTRGADDSEELLEDRQYKYRHVCHAEANAVYNAARHGARLLGGKAFVTFPPCFECSKILVQAGIREVYIDANSLSGPRAEVWMKDNWDEVTALFRHANITLNFLDDEGLYVGV